MTLAAVRLNKFAWVPVVGVEIHSQINSLSKLFSSAPNSNPSKSSLNSNFDLFDVSMPGSLPRLNEYCVKSAVKTSLALGLIVNKVSVFDRKHYFYADLPSGYQITQQRMPLASGGHLSYPVYSRNNRNLSPLSEAIVRFDRLQLEHDSAKTVNMPISSNDQNETVLIDMNRCGVPLMEIVTQPDFQFGYQVAAFVKEVMSILTSVNTCECKFHEGTIRVDTSVSVHRPDSLPPHCLHPQMTSLKSPPVEVTSQGGIRKVHVDDMSAKDEPNLISFRCEVERLDNKYFCDIDSTQPQGGTIVEIKNINSIKFLTEAIDFEIMRQIEIYEGKTHNNNSETDALVENETRAYNSSAERKTVPMRDKTKVHDYRFLPETNLPPLVLKSTPDDRSGLPDVVISDIKLSILQLPADIRRQLVGDFNLTSHSLGILSEYHLFDLFNHLIHISATEISVRNANTLLSWVLNTLMVQARPPVKKDFLFKIDVQLILLSNLKDEHFMDSGHVLRAVQLMQKLDDIERDQLRDLSAFKKWLIDQRCVIKIPNEDTMIIFEDFCSQNLDRMKSVANEFETGANIDAFSLLSCSKFHKLQNKFGRKTKLQHDSDFAFNLFLRKLN